MERTFISVLFCILSAAGFSGITNVEVSPLIPAINDPITIITTGLEGSGGVLITNSVWQINGTAIVLDLYVSTGMLTVMTPWSHSDAIGTLTQGNYSLTVNEFYSPGFPLPPDTYTTSFAVVTPEPSTLILLSMGCFLCKRKG